MLYGQKSPNPPICHRWAELVLGWVLWVTSQVQGLAHRCVQLSTSDPFLMLTVLFVGSATAKASPCTFLVEVPAQQCCSSHSVCVHRCSSGVLQPSWAPCPHSCVTLWHCLISQGFTNTIHIFSGGKRRSRGEAQGLAPCPASFLDCWFPKRGSASCFQGVAGRKEWKSAVSFAHF